MMMGGIVAMSFEDEVLDRLARLEINQDLTMNAIQALCEKAGLEDRVAQIAAQLRMRALERNVDRERDTDPALPSPRDSMGDPEDA